MKASETTNIVRITKLASALPKEARDAVAERLGQGLTDEALKAAVEIEERFLALSAHGRTYALATIQSFNGAEPEAPVAPSAAENPQPTP